MNTQYSSNGFIKLVESPEEEYELGMNQKMMDSEDGNDEDLKYYPIACSSGSYSFHESEKDIIDKLR